MNLISSFVQGKKHFIVKKQNTTVIQYYYDLIHFFKFSHSFLFTISFNGKANQSSDACNFSVLYPNGMKLCLTMLICSVNDDGLETANGQHNVISHKVYHIKSWTWMHLITVGMSCVSYFKVCYRAF